MWVRVPPWAPENIFWYIQGFLIQSPSGKARVCKTLIRRFDSALDLMQIKNKTPYIIIILLISVIIIFFIFNNKKQPDIKTPIKIEKKDIDILIKEKDEFGRKITQTRSSDPDCTGGILEHIYYGELKEDKPVKIILSCDQERFNIVGSVIQIIDSTNESDMPQNDSFNALADISNGSQVVYLEDDYNFDGYNDLASISSNGSGVDSYNIFLYDKKLEKFVFNTELSKLQNILVNENNKYVFEDFSYYEGDKYIEDYRRYKWVNGHLVKVE